MAGGSWGRWTGGTGGASGESTIDDVPEPVHTLMVQFSTYVLPVFRISNDRKVPRARCVAGLDRFRHQGHEHMGELISLAERRTARAEAHAPPVRPRVSFYFDLASPWTYLAAERVDQRFADVRWAPAVGDGTAGRARRRRAARRGRGARRRAAHAAGVARVGGRCPGAARCASPPWRSSAAARRSSSWPPAAWPSAAATTSTIPRSWPRRPPPPAWACPDCLHAAGELRRDVPLEQAALRLLSQGADALPVLVVGRALFCGEHRLAEAAAAASGRGATRPPARRSFGG